MIIKVARTTPTHPKLSMRNSTNQELAHNREHGNSNWLKPCKGVLLYPHDTRTMQLTQPAKLDKGVLVSTVSNEAQPLRVRPACAESNLDPPGTPLSLSTQPMATHLGPGLNDQIKEGNWLIRTIIWICGSTKGCSKSMASRTVLKRSKRTMPMWRHSLGPTIPLESR